MLLATTIDVNPLQRITSGAEDLLAGFLEQLPQVGVGLVILVLGLLVARVVRWAVRRSLAATTDRSTVFLRVMSRLAGILTIALFVMLALVAAVPSIDLAAIIGALGIGSIAIGFAFSDILQNTLAGLLILFRQPFRVGDQIVVDDHAGTVVDVSIRETSLKTFDGRIVLIPNADVYGSRVTVQTARELVRTTVVVGVDYDTDLAVARQVALAALDGIEAVADDPAPEAYYTGFGASSIDLDLRFWTHSTQAEIRAAQDEVVEAITGAFRRESIDIPFTIVDLQTSDELRRALAGSA